MAQQPENQEEKPTVITATVHRSVFSAAVGQINIHLTRRSYKELLYEELAGACHDDLEKIRKVISDREIFCAVKCQALQNNDIGQLVRRNKWVDYAWATMQLVGVLVVLMLALFIDFHLPRNGATLQQRMLVWAMITGAALFGFWVLTQHVWPQLTAKRAMRVLDTQQSVGG